MNTARVRAVGGAVPEAAAPASVVSIPGTGPIVASQFRGEGPAETLRRRVIYLMLFRLLLISLVLGSTLVLWWLSDVNLATPSSMMLYAIIAATYLLTIIYALAVNRVTDLGQLATVQLIIDLIISALLVHITGGAQSAYTFFFPLSIIAAAIIHYRTGALIMALTAALLFVGVACFGWLELLPVPAGQRVLPSGLSAVELGRAVALNLAACAGVAMLSSNLSGQILRTSASLESQRSVAADLYALHEDIVRSLPSGLITVDEHGQISTINQAAYRILGLARREPEDSAAGSSLRTIMPGIERHLAALPERQSAHRLDLTLRGDDGSEQYLGLSVSPLRDNADRVIGRVINFQDLTELRALEQQMRQAERLAVVGTLAAGVAHELRNPLAAISGSIELLRTAPDSDDDNHTLMDIVTREVERLDALIRDLLDYTNPQPRELVRFDLVSLVDETVEAISHDRSLGAVEIGCAPDSAEAVEIVADPGRIRQVLWNLMRNAGEAAEGRVEVRVAAGDAAGDAVVIEVCDDGAGIEPAHLERVFEPFFSTKSKGTGLGLATCHSIITEHGGTIRAENRPGGGCAFLIELPLPAPMAEVALSEGREGEAGAVSVAPRENELKPASVGEHV